MGQHAVGHRHVDVATLPAALGFDDGGQDAHRGGQRATEQVGDLEIRDGRLAAFAAHLIEHAGIAEVIDVVPGEIAVGTVLPVAADRAVGDARVSRRHRGVADAELVHDAGAEAFDDDVRARRQPQEDLDPRRLLEVEAQPALVAVDHPEVGAVLACAGTERARVVADFGILDLDDIRPEVGEMQRRHRAGQQPGQVEDADAGERQRPAHGAQAPSRSASSSISIPFCNSLSMNMPR